MIADELAAQGVVAGENRVARLCSQQRIWSVHTKKRGLNRMAGPPVHDDLAQRGFTTTGPILVWLTDITEHATGEGKLYLCAIKDGYSNRIVGARWPVAVGRRVRVRARTTVCRLQPGEDRTAPSLDRKLATSVYVR